MIKEGARDAGSLMMRGTGCTPGDFSLDLVIFKLAL